MNQNVYTYMAAAIRCVREGADAAHAAALRGEPYAAPDSQITLQEHGYRVTIARVASAPDASPRKSVPARFFSVDGGHVRKPWRTRGGKHVRPADLVEAIRPAWPGVKALCQKSMFDCRLETLISWLHQCVEMGLLKKVGRRYEVSSYGMEVAR
jgi:hypothetical protein